MRATKEAMGWDPDATFLVPDGVYEAFSAVDSRRRGPGRVAGALRRLAAATTPTSPRSGTPPGAGPAAARAAAERCASIDWGKPKLATRVAGQKSMAAFADFVPTMVGGAADLERVDQDRVPGRRRRALHARQGGRNVFFGVREHGMGGTVNGLAAHGGIVRPYGSTFLQFADYMRGSIRLSAR